MGTQKLAWPIGYGDCASAEWLHRLNQVMH
jgi:hypothetical protein